MTSDYAFAPLSLTKALPFLPLSQGAVDYEVYKRENPALIDELSELDSTRVLLVNGSKIAVPRGQGAQSQNESVRLRAAMLPATYVRSLIEARKTDTNICVAFLGSDSTYSYLSLQFRLIQQGSAPISPALTEMENRFDWVDLRAFAPRASSLEVGLAVSAVTIAGWQMQQRFCPQCGFPVETINAGWAQRCTNPEHGVVLFPRIEPAVITSVVDSQDRILLQHNIGWKRPKLMSVSAGFVEAGESLEHAVRRETEEEVGIKIGDVVYLGSQPWPFQRSLMVAFKARALTTDIHVDGVEVESARWFSRDEFTTALANGEFDLPKRAAVARYQIQEWYGQEL